MPWWNPFEQRAAPMRSTSHEGIMQVLFGGDYAGSSTGITVTIENALTVPAVLAAVNFIAETMASLPAELYRDSRAGRAEVTSPISRLFSDAANDFTSAFEFRKQLYVDKLTHGRGLAYIERGETGAPINLWAMDPARTTIKRDNWANIYEFSNPDGRKLIYSAADVIDLPWMLRSDGFTHRSPIALGREAIGLALAATQYGSKFLANGGVPPFAITGNFQAPAAAQRAADDFAAAVKKAATQSRQALVLPTGVEIKQIGANPDDSQLVELQRFCIEQIARLYSLPPIFLQDLTHGTFSNTEQQDLHFAKHTVLHHVEQFEREVNLKIFGRRSNSQSLELEMDGLLRGDFKTRMDGWARAVQGGILTPNEARESENFPPMEGGDKLFMQGATMPIDALSSVSDVAGTVQA